MKDSTIMDIFHGKKGHIDTIKTSVNTLKDLEKICIVQEKLEKELSVEHLKLFREFNALLEKYWSDELNLFFVEGFKIGVNVGFECKNN